MMNKADRKKIADDLYHWLMRNPPPDPRMNIPEILILRLQHWTDGFAQAARRAYWQLINKQKRLTPREP